MPAVQTINCRRPKFGSLLDRNGGVERIPGDEVPSIPSKLKRNQDRCAWDGDGLFSGL